MQAKIANTSAAQAIGAESQYRPNDPSKEQDVLVETDVADRMEPRTQSVEDNKTQDVVESPLTRATEQPQNGLNGLKHWRHDMLAGLVVALVSVPLSLGIALASGAPPICGLTSEIIAGLIFPLLGGAYVTISGPAAGLGPVLYSSIAALGHGDMHRGYQLILGVIMFAGITQIILTKLNAAKFSYLIPRSAIHGMLAAIGLMIIAKQIPNFIGLKYEAHEFFGAVESKGEYVMGITGAKLPDQPTGRRNTSSMTVRPSTL